MEHQPIPFCGMNRTRHYGNMTVKMSIDTVTHLARQMECVDVCAREMCPERVPSDMESLLTYPK